MLSRILFKSSIIRLCSTAAPANPVLLESVSALIPDVDETTLKEVFQASPLLQQYNLNTWQRSHNTFLNIGIRPETFLKIVAGYPQLLGRSEKQLHRSVEVWRGSQFGDRRVSQLLERYPELLDYSNEKELLTRVGYLKDYSGNLVNVWRLFMSSVNLVVDKEMEIEKKIVYIRDVMRIEAPEAVKSEVFSKSLEEIQCRHVFLERLGMFKPRSKKVDPNEPTTNPRLYQIMDTSDKRFATKVCFVTLEEFEAFQLLYKRELERYKDEDDNDSDLDDVDYPDDGKYK